jgi:hypothetical protein
MILAELEVYHSRPVAPTRRVALGRMTLPVDPPPGFGGILLGGVIANNVGSIDPELLPDLAKLTTQLENGLRVPQPRLRYRFQKDRVGLQPSVHRLLAIDDVLSFSFDDEHGLPAQQILGAVYAAGELPLRHRRAVMGTIRRAIGWQGPIGPELITALAGFNSGANWSAHALTHPIEWAMGVFGWSGAGVASTNGRGNGHAAAGAGNGSGATDGNGNGNGTARAGSITIDGTGAGPTKSEIQRQYRKLLIAAHPDHGGETKEAAQRIADLTEARRILLG